MAKKKIEVIIDAETKKIKSKLKDVSKQVDKFGKDAKKSTKQGSDGFLAMAKKVGLVAAAMIALRKGVALVKNAILGATKQDKIYNSLAGAVRNVGKSYEEVEGSLKILFATQQEQTKYGDTDSAAMLDKLIAYSGNYEASVKNLALAQDMASSSIFEADSASRYLGMALAGNIEMLGRYIPELKSTNNAQLETMTTAEKVAYAVEVLGDKFGGLAANEMDVLQGKIGKLKNFLGDLSEAFGDKLTPTVEDGVDALTDFTKSMVKIIETPLSETIEKERIEFNTLFDILQDVNVSQSTRNTTIETLQNQYPDYIDNIDLEKAAIKDIAKFQKEVNESMLERIRIEAARGMLAEKEEKLTKQKVKEYKIDYDLKEQKYKIIEQREKLVELGRKDREQGEESRKEQALAYTTQQGILNSLIEHETHLTGKLENKRNKVKELQAEYDKFYKFLIASKTIEDDNKKDIVDLTEKQLIAVEKINEKVTKAIFEMYGLTKKQLDNVQKEIEEIFATWNLEEMVLQNKQFVDADIKGIEKRIEAREELEYLLKDNFQKEIWRIEEQADAWRDAGLQEVDIATWVAQEKAKLYQNTAQQFISGIAQSAKAMAEAGMISGQAAKRAAQMQAIVDTYASANAAFKAMAGIPVVGPALGYAAATAAVLAGLANVKIIESQKFASGGSMMVTGSGGADSQTIPIRVSPGERATTIIETPQQINNNNNVQIIGDFTITGRDLHYVLKKYEDDIL